LPNRFLNTHKSTPARHILASSESQTPSLSKKLGVYAPR